MELQTVVEDHDYQNQESCRILPTEQDEEEKFSLKNLDRLDWIAMGVVFLLVIAMLSVILTQQDQPGPADTLRAGSRQAVIIISPEFDNKIKVTKNLLAAGSIAKARELIDSMINDYPYDGRPYMLLGDLFVYKQQPIKAMLEYQKGIDLNPDFLDKKAKNVFRGKQVKGLLNEARAAITTGLRENPGDPVLREQLEVLYYMLRRVAGSCG